jgi:hypothetical protein
LKLFAIFIFSFFSFFARAERTEINKVLFSAGDQSWTSRDMSLYQSVLSDVFKKKKLSEFSKNEFNDFLLSRISLKEADIFQISYDKKSLSESERKKLTQFTKDEIDKEVTSIAKAQALIEIKENQHKDAARFNTWLELMKRKYVVRIKSGENK